MTAYLPTAETTTTTTVAAALPLLDELALLEGLLRDDVSAWQDFNARYGRQLRACIARIAARFGYRDADHVQEIYSILCLQLLNNDKRKLRSFEPGRGTRFGTWLGLLASHAAYDFLRSERRHPKGDELDSLQVASDALDPSESTLLRERRRLLSSALSDLSAKDREFMELYFEQGLSPELVAARMGIHVKTVYTKKHKLQARLQSALLAQPLAA